MSIFDTIYAFGVLAVIFGGLDLLTNGKDSYIAKIIGKLVGYKDDKKTDKKAT